MNVVVTCEHASNAVPQELRALGLPAATLRSHVAFDPGALAVARVLARALRAPLLAGTWSRLVVDLNRSEGHPRVIARRVGGRTVPGNRLDAAARAERLQRYWQPFRLRAGRAIANAVARGACLHLSVHSFVERLHGVERRNDVGLLFDPRRPRERAFVTALQQQLQAHGISVRKNFPYFGHTDGHTQALRSRFAASRYLGIEIELNQRLMRHGQSRRHVTHVLGAVLATGR